MIRRRDETVASRHEPACAWFALRFGVSYVVQPTATTYVRACRQLP